MPSEYDALLATEQPTAGSASDYDALLAAAPSEYDALTAAASPSSAKSLAPTDPNLPENIKSGLEQLRLNPEGSPGFAAASESPDVQAALDYLRPPPNEPAGSVFGHFDRVEQKTGVIPQVAGGLANVAIDVGESLTSPQNLALLPAAGIRGVGRLAGLLFGAQAFADLPDAARATIAPDKTLQERIQSGGRTLTDLLFGGLGVGHGLGADVAVSKIAERPRPTVTEKLFPEPKDPIAEAAAPPTVPEVAQAASEITKVAETKTPVEIPRELSPNEPITSTGRNGTEAPTSEVLGERNGPPPSDAVPAVVEEPVRPPNDETAPRTDTQGDVMSPGPGAASAKEPLASYEQRRFGQRFQEDQNISPEIREQTGNQFYEPASNVKTVAEAENLIEAYGTDTAARMVRDESAPIEPRVRSTVAQGLIKKLNQSYQEAKAAGDTPRAQEFLNQSVDTAEYLSELGTKLGQGVQSFAIWSRLSPEGMLASAKRMAERSGSELAPDVQEKILNLTDEVHKAPEGFQKSEKTMQLMNYMADLKGINPAEIPTALWYSNILSGFTTQLVNTIDTGLNVLSESAAMAASHPTAVPDILTGLYQGMIKGGFEAANVLKTGRSAAGDKISQQRVLERVKFGEPGVPMNPDTALGRFMKTAFESKPAKVLNLWKYPLRAMVASDTVFFNSFKEARARVLARAMAKKEGLSGDALFERVDQLLNETPGKKDAAIEQAKSEGLEGVNLARRSREIIEQGRPEELVSSADEAAAIATYNHDPSGALGLIAHHISQITENFPLGKFVVPFTRIVANVTNRGLDYTPWGYKRLFFGEWGGKKFGTEPPVGEAYRTQLAKATAGTTAMAALGALDANNTIQVTAKGPDNPAEQKQLRSAGWTPYSVKIGDTYYSYQYTPLNIGLAMIGHYRDAVRYNKLGEKDVQTRLAYGMLKASSTIFDMSFLSGVSDFMETVQGATSSTKGAGRLFARTASSVVVPNLVKQIDKLFDPTVYQADDIQQALVRETPIARSLTQKPMLNALGEPIKGSQNRFFAFGTNDPVWKLITEKQAWVPIPSKTTKIGNRAITPDEYYQLIEKSGPRIRAYITNHLDRFQALPAQKVQEEIRDAAIRERDRVKRKFR